MDATSTLSGRPEDPEWASYCVLPQPQSLPWCQDQDETPGWLQISVTKWERVLGSFETEVPAAIWSLLSSPWPDYIMFFAVWSPLLFLNGDSKQILIYFACAVLDAVDF